jgi:short-subunit dehydrogenase
MASVSIHHEVGPPIRIRSDLGAGSRALPPSMPINGVHGGTKAFVLTLSVSLNHELAGKGVRVPVVLPGATAAGVSGQSRRERSGGTVGGDRP